MQVAAAKASCSANSLPLSTRLAQSKGSWRNLRVQDSLLPDSWRFRTGGRPRERSVEARPRRCEVAAVHSDSPNGLPRWADRRRAANSVSVNAAFTFATQFGGRNGDRYSFHGFAFAGLAFCGRLSREPATPRDLPSRASAVGALFSTNLAFHPCSSVAAFTPLPARLPSLSPNHRTMAAGHFHQSSFRIPQFPVPRPPLNVQRYKTCTSLFPARPPAISAMQPGPAQALRRRSLITELCF
jgi:hypothetical protein